MVFLEDDDKTRGGGSRERFTYHISTYIPLIRKQGLDWFRNKAYKTQEGRQASTDTSLTTPKDLHPFCVNVMMTMTMKMDSSNNNNTRTTRA